MPPTTDRSSLLSRHEDGLITEHRNIMILGGGHRSSKYASHILPRCRALVEAIGHRMVYDAAISFGVPQSLIDLYVCDVVKLDLGWYIEHKFLTRAALNDMEDAAISSAQPHIHRWATELQVAPYVTAPIVSDGNWGSFVGALKRYGNDHAEIEAKL